MANTDKSILRNITDRLTCTQVLNIMVFLGFMLNYALRVNLTIAIVAMVEKANTTVEAVLNSTVNATFNSTGELDMVQQSRFTWDVHQQNMLLGCFFWGYILTELPGGRLAEIVGARRVFGYCMLGASVITLLSPLAAHTAHAALVALRVLLGFMLGATWPAILPMASKWVPPMDRSKFMSNMMASSLGAAVTMPICGFLIAHYGWESTFYATGVIGMLWSLVWFAVVFDSPAEHPRISDEERNYIQKCIGVSATTTRHGSLRVPWRAILSSPCVWAIIITHGTSVFGYFTVVNQLPTYIKTVLHYDIKANGLLSSLPYLGKYACALGSSILADRLRRQGALSTTATRKIFTTFAVGTPAILMVVQVFFGYDRVWAIAIFTVALTLNGAVTAGYLGNGLDIAPNFSGTIFGMANTLSSMGGFLSTFMVASLTQHDATFGQWQIVFGVLAVTYLVGALSFLTMGTGELQPWNDEDQKQNQNHHEANNGVYKHCEEELPLNGKVQA